jgi:hypothetical protein
MTLEQMALCLAVSWILFREFYIWRLFRLLESVRLDRNRALEEANASLALARESISELKGGGG